MNSAAVAGGDEGTKGIINTSDLDTGMTISDNLLFDSDPVSWGKWTNYFNNLPDYDALLLESSMKVIKITEGPGSLAKMLSDSEATCDDNMLSAFTKFYHKVVDKAESHEKSHESKSQPPSIRGICRDKPPAKLREFLSIPQNLVAINARGGLGGSTALMVAIGSRYGELVNILKEFGVNQSVVDQSHLTAYDRAEVQGKQAMLKLLDPQYSRLGRLVYLICLDDVESFKSFLEDEKFKSKINDPFPFRISEHRQFLKTPDAHRDGSPSHRWEEVTTLLRCAALLSREGCLKLLKENEVDMADKVAYLLANRDDGATKSILSLFDVKRLLRDESDLKSPLKAGDAAFLNILLTNHPKLLNEKDEEGNTPLLRAVKRGDLKCVEELLSHGADQKIRDQENQTPYDHANDAIRIVLCSSHATIGPLYADDEKQLPVKVITQCDTPSLLHLGTYMPRDKDKGPVPVMVSLKTSHLNFEAESAFYELVKQQLKPNDKILECIRLAPEYLVLEHFGEDLRSYYQADLAVRTGPLVDEILSAVHALHHGLGYVHGDLQPASIRIFDVRGQFFCKLCHFHNACKAGEPFPTVGGNLSLTDAWTCPELVRARFTKEAIDGTFQMDIFSLGMIVDLLCRPSQDLDTSSVIQFDKNLFLPEGTGLPLSAKEREALFFRSISCLRNDHWLRDLLLAMLSFDPWQRGGDVQIYRDALQNKSASSLYQELCLRERISIRNEEKLEAQVGDMSRVLNNFSEVMKDRFAEMRNLMKSDLLTFTQSSSDEIKRQVESIVTRLTAVNETMGKSFFGNLEATISGQMNLVSIEMVKKLDESSSCLGEQLTRMEKEIKEENDQLKGLSEDIKLLNLKGDTLAERVNSFADLALESFGGLTALVESAASTAELQTFCEQFTKNFQSTASGMIQEVGKLVGENEQIPQILTRLEEIGRRQQEDKGQLQADQSEVKSLVEELSKVMASQAVTANQNMEQVYDSIQDILQRLVLPSVTDPSSLGTALDARMDSIEALITAAATARGGAQNQDLLPEFRELATKFQLHDTEMKQMIAEVVDEIESIRNFQDLSVLEAQHYPFLFIIWEERLKESFQGLFGKAVNGIRESLYRHYRVHFCCNVCGKVAQSGSKARKMDRGWIQGACDRMSLVDPEQGGYPLTVMRRSVVKFLKYARIVLSALELGAMVAGVSVAKLVSTVSNQLNIADDMKRLADSIHDEKWIPKTSRNAMENALRLEDEGDGKRDRVMTSRDAMDAGGSDNKEKLQAVMEKGVEGRQTTRAELEAVWKSQRPHVTLEHAKMAKELLHLLKDPTGDDTGLERCSLSDGTCAWVCPEDPSDPQSCFKRFQFEGYDCCLAGLEHFLTKKAK